MWAIPIQKASFKGVEFDVIAVEEAFERAVIEHTYPFVNGADLEDMGLNPQQVQLQAVFFGLSYATRYNQLLSVIQQKGADVLVHPVRGRLQNMMLCSARLRHDAENVNYVAVDLTFREASEMQPIFAFEESLISKIDRFLLNLESVFDTAMNYWNSAMGFNAVMNFKSRLLGMWGGLFASFEAVRDLFGLDKKKYAISSSTSQRTYLGDGKVALAQLKEMIDYGVQSRAELPALSFKSQFLAITQAVENTQQVATQVAKDEGFNRSKTVKLRGADVVELSIMLDVMTTAKLAKVFTEIIEEKGDELLISDLELINQTMREHCLSLVNKLREQQKNSQLGAKNDKTQQVYETAEATINAIRNIAHQFTQMILSVINQKPPLTVRQVMQNGTIHKVAHHFYGDYARSDELLRLNPQIRQPNFIEQGMWLNCYAE